MWSACECVKRIAWTRRTSLTSACIRRSVEVSTRIDRTARAKAGCALSSPGCSSSRIDGRVRRSFGSVERQTAQAHPIDGKPCDVPLPSTVTLRLNNPLSAAGRFDEAQAKLVEHRLEHLTFFGGEVALGLLLEERENLDHLRGAFEVRLARLARCRIGQIAEMNRGAAGERDHERGERQSRRRHRYRVSNPVVTEERHEPPRRHEGTKRRGTKRLPKRTTRPCWPEVDRIVQPSYAVRHGAVCVDAVCLPLGCAHGIALLTRDRRRASAADRPIARP